MKIIKLNKLNDEKKYDLEQTLSGHTCHVMNPIEIRDNEIISFSLDTNMKKLELKIMNLNVPKQLTSKNQARIVIF